MFFPLHTYHNPKTEVEREPQSADITVTARTQARTLPSISGGPSKDVCFRDASSLPSYLGTESRTLPRSCRSVMQKSMQPASPKWFWCIPRSNSKKETYFQWEGKAQPSLGYLPRALHHSTQHQDGCISTKALAHYLHVICNWGGRIRLAVYGAFGYGGSLHNGHVRITNRAAAVTSGMGL